MLFEIHPEGKIAYKRLSDADLKRSAASNQTHIGLSNDSLTFMPDNKTEYSAMLIYNEYCDILNCEIAKIHRADGRNDAPKISMGRKADNIVRKIRTFANQSINKDFYLFWFGLDSLTPVFWLIEEGSEDYNYLDQLCDLSTLPNRKIIILNRNHKPFIKVLDYIKAKIENVAINLEKDLELSAEMGIDDPKFKEVDVKKAKNHIYEIGRLGETYIDEYLEEQSFFHAIKKYEWVNKSGEQGKPFDFYIEYYNGLEEWIDVKATERSFEQPIIISKNELKFITEKDERNYNIYRVYSMQNDWAKLKICSRCLKYIKKLYRDIDYMTQSMSDYKAALVNYKISIEPTSDSFLDISNEIILKAPWGYLDPNKDVLFL